MEEGKNNVVEFKKDIKEIIMTEIERLVLVNKALSNRDSILQETEIVREIRENVIVITQLLNQLEMRNK